MFTSHNLSKTSHFIHFMRSRKPSKYLRATFEGLRANIKCLRATICQKRATSSTLCAHVNPPNNCEPLSKVCEPLLKAFESLSGVCEPLLKALESLSECFEPLLKNLLKIKNNYHPLFSPNMLKPKNACRNLHQL